MTTITLTLTETWNPMLELWSKSTGRLYKQYVYDNTNEIHFEELGSWILCKNHTHMLDHFHICSFKMSCCRTVNQSDSHIETRIRIAILRWPAQSTEIPKLRLFENGRNLDKHCTFYWVMWVIWQGIVLYVSHLVLHVSHLVLNMNHRWSIQQPYMVRVSILYVPTRTFCMWLHAMKNTTTLYIYVHVSTWKAEPSLTNHQLWMTMSKIPRNTRCGRH